jgi:hypothetical protein
MQAKFDGKIEVRMRKEDIRILKKYAEKKRMKVAHVVRNLIFNELVSKKEIV